MIASGGGNDVYTAAKRPLLLAVLCVVSVLLGGVQLFGGAQLAFGWAASPAGQTSTAWDQEASHGAGVSIRSEEADINITIPDVAIQNDRERALAPSTGWCTMFCALLSIWGAVWLWRMKRSGLWLFLGAGLLYTAVVGRYEDASALSGIVSIAITLALTLAFTALFAAHWRVLR